MAARLTDTSAEARRVHVTLVRRAAPAQRLEMARSLSDTVGRMSWQNLRRRYPEDTATEAAVRFVKLVYGAELARRLHQFLLRRPS